MTNELLPSIAMVTPVEQRGRKPGRFSAVLGVIAVAVIATAIAVTVWARDSGGSADPLFVLPVPADDWQLTDGAVADPADDVPGTAERFIKSGRLFGVADGDGYVDLRSEAIYRETPLAGARWDEIDSSEIGTGYLRADDSITVARQEWNDSWQVASSPDDLVHVYDLLGNDIRDNMIMITAFSPPERREGPATSFEMISPDGSTFSVDTSASDSPLFDVATFAERVEPVDINGASGWVITDELEEATATAVTWSPENGRTVTVRSTAASDAAVDVARLLQTVSENEWTAVFPDTQVD